MTTSNPLATPAQRVGIATPHSAATDAAAGVVRRGGSVVDAAITAAAVLSVVYPHNTGLGGDLIALYREPDGRTHCINASGPAPARVDADALRRRYPAGLPVSGPDTITVPGAVAGWERLHALGGRLPWPSLFEEAVRLARDGVPVAPSLALAIAAIGDSDRELRSLFARDGRPLALGEPLRQPALAATLTELAEDGAAAMYGGALGHRLAAALEQRGCPLRVDDLAGYRAQLVEPLSREALGWTLSTAPPNSQGFSLLQTLAALEDAPASGPSPAAVLAQLFFRANEDRQRLLADPAFAPSAAAELLRPGRVHDVARSAFRPSSVVRAAAGAARRPNGDTVAVSVLSDDGSAVSLIQSLFHSFGSQVVDPGTGVVLHNRGAFFSLAPGSPNVIAPGKRPAHTLMPLLVSDEDGLRLCGGTMGGKAQPQIHAQLLLALRGGATLTEAVAAPRWIVGGSEVGQREDAVHVEASVDAATRVALSADGWTLTELPDHSEETGHAQYVGIDADGVMVAATDPRADGTATVVAS